MTDHSSNPRPSDETPFNTDPAASERRSPEPPETAPSAEAAPADRAAPDRPAADRAAPDRAAIGGQTKPGASAQDSDPTRDLDRALRAQLATVTGGLAPEPYVEAWWDWYLNLAKEPGRQVEIMQDAITKAMDSWSFALKASTGQTLPPASGDQRYEAQGWEQFPFNIYAHSFKNLTDWWQNAWASVPGVARKSEQMLEFATRNALEVVSPSNYLATNPELLETTRAESGANLVRGFHYWLEDIEQALQGANGETSSDPNGGTSAELNGGTGAELNGGTSADLNGGTSAAPGGDRVSEKPRYVVGRDVAVTPGKVILRNELLELIQYSPMTETVYAEPVLIIPAWIMKYYILDLSPANSLVRYLVSQGHTVFMVSWKNPGASDSNLGMDDYLDLGARAAVDAVARVVPHRPIHAVGYCIGGTLLSIAAARLAAEHDPRLASMTLLAAQQDFSEPGELSLFISPSQLDMLEAVMQRKGVLTSEQMGGAFAMLRSRDLLWTPAVNSYLKGQRETPNDLMAWNADGTRMPYRMHAEYLRKLYLHNELARGEFESHGERIDLARIRLPMFVVGTETDHVAPWRSVYKARNLTRSSDYTFLLTSGGHNAGIVSGPTHPRRRHRVRTWSNPTESLTPDAWLESTPPVHGSWWPVWEHWLVAHSSAQRIAPPSTGSAADRPLADAPGTYVLQK